MLSVRCYQRDLPLGVVALHRDIDIPQGTWRGQVYKPEFVGTCRKTTPWECIVARASHKRNPTLTTRQGYECLTIYCGERLLGTPL